MKTIKIIFTTLILFSFTFCNNKNDRNNNSFYDTVEVKIYDTIKILMEPNMKITSDESFEIATGVSEKFYNLVKDNEYFDDNFSAKFNSNGVRPSNFIFAMILEEDKVNEGIVLFFLKLLKSQIIGKYHTPNIRVASDTNPYLCLFSYQYFKLSNTMGPLITSDIYKWVEMQPHYLDNPDIKAEFEIIQDFQNKE